MKIILLIAIMYLEFSFLEVFWHKVIMHNKPDSFIRRWGIYDDTHIKHHLSEANDMYSKKGHDDDLHFEYWDDLKYANLIVFIIWYYTIQIFYSVPWYYVLLLSFIVMVIYNIIYDELHYSIHKIDECEYKDNFIFTWLYKNHKIHHLVKGENKGNYNILCPGADHILGLYNEKVKPLSKPLSKKLV
tara:strand:+ start:531 stop:1091 length:561 start_codon:yes stop_codon:yes gene_type:complete